MITGNELMQTIVKPEYTYSDLTIRQYFAAMAMQGLLANPKCLDLCNAAGMIENADKFYALCAVEHADALIAELNK